MGTVIAYDCLKRVADAPVVDGLITHRQPPRHRRGPGPAASRSGAAIRDTPFEKVRGRWVNVYDKLDPVAGFDPKLRQRLPIPRHVQGRGHQRAETLARGVTTSASTCTARSLRKALRELLVISEEGAVGWSQGEFLERLKTTVERFDRDGASLLCDELIAQLYRGTVLGDGMGPEDLALLRRKTYFGQMERVAEVAPLHQHRTTPRFGVSMPRH